VCPLLHAWLFTRVVKFMIMKFGVIESAEIYASWRTFFASENLVLEIPFLSAGYIVLQVGHWLQDSLCGYWRQTRLLSKAVHGLNWQWYPITTLLLLLGINFVAVVSRLQSQSLQFCSIASCLLFHILPGLAETIRESLMICC
jgi:hypothetical protein